MKNFFHPHEKSFPTDKNRLEMQCAYIQIVMICVYKCVIFAIIQSVWKTVALDNLNSGVTGFSEYKYKPCIAGAGIIECNRTFKDFFSLSFIIRNATRNSKIKNMCF